MNEWLVMVVCFPFYYRWKESIAKEDIKLKVNKFVQWKLCWILVLCRSQIIFIIINFFELQIPYLQAYPMKTEAILVVERIIHVCTPSEHNNKME